MEEILIGVTDRSIPLTQGQVAIIDAADFEWLNQWKWCAFWHPHTKSFRAMRGEYLGGGRANCKVRGIFMHRLIVGLEHGDPRRVDHWNHDTLDNRRQNLRICNNNQNARNARVRSDNKTGFKGVAWCGGKKQRFCAYISVDGRTKHLGYFPDAISAAMAYNVAAKEHYGDFAFLNPMPEVT